MARKKGRMMYVPRVVIEELGDIMQEEQIFERSIAFRKMVEHTKVGRELERIRKLDFRNIKKSLPVTSPTHNKKYKRVGSRSIVEDLL